MLLKPSLFKNVIISHFTTLNYTLNYILHPKIFKCIICTINYNHCYTLYPDFKFSVNLDKNPKFRVQKCNRDSRVQFRMVKCNVFFVFKGLRRQKIWFFHVMSYFSIQVNDKLNVGVQSVRRVIIQGRKRAFRKFQGAKCNLRYSLGW